MTGRARRARRAPAPGGPAPQGRQLPLLELGAQPEHWPWPEGSHVAPAFPCAVATRRGRDALPVLRAAGERRFEDAVARLRAAAAAGAEAARGRSASHGPSGGSESGAAWEQVAYEALAGALGYERNEAPLRTLAAAIPLARARRPHRGGDAGARYEALYLGSAGLLPSQRHLPAARRGGAQAGALERAWQDLGLAPALRAYNWEHGGRPENAPLRRVLALSRLVQHWPREGLVSAVAGALSSREVRGGWRWQGRPPPRRPAPGGAAPAPLAAVTTGGGTGTSASPTPEGRRGASWAPPGRRTW